MVARNNLLEAPPYAVEQALRKLGGNLRVARLRREQTIEEVARENWDWGPRRARCRERQSLNGRWRLRRLALGL